MPLTPNGTAYTLYSAPIAGTGAGTCRWGIADAHLGDTGIPTILYAHGANGDSKQFQDLAAWAEMRNWLIDNGWLWIEGSGGGTQSWGNDNARNAYVAYLDHVAGVLDIGDVVPLGRSMGGLVSYWLYSQSSIKDQCVGLIVNSGVTSMAAAGPYFGLPLWQAFGTTTLDDFLVASADYDPLGFDVDLWDGLNILELVGTADTTVPPDDHAYAIRALWEGHPAMDLLTVRQSGDHSASNGCYHEVGSMTAFLNLVTGVTPPLPGTIFRRRAAYYIGPDMLRYPLVVTTSS